MYSNDRTGQHPARTAEHPSRRESVLPPQFHHLDRPIIGQDYWSDSHHDDGIHGGHRDIPEYRDSRPRMERNSRFEPKYFSISHLPEFKNQTINEFSRQNEKYDRNTREDVTDLHTDNWGGYRRSEPDMHRLDYNLLRPGGGREMDVAHYMTAMADQSAWLDKQEQEIDLWSDLLLSSLYTYPYLRISLDLVTFYNFLAIFIEVILYIAFTDIIILRNTIWNISEK